MRSRYSQMLYFSLRLALGTLFIFTSLDKIWHPGLFAEAISNYHLLPLPLLNMSAIFLGWLELICGLALVFNFWPRAANGILGALLILFTGSILIAMLRGLDFNCGCFDLFSKDQNIGLAKLAQNGILILVSLLLEGLLRPERPQEQV